MKIATRVVLSMLDSRNKSHISVKIATSILESVRSWSVPYKSVLVLQRDISVTLLLSIVYTGLTPPDILNQKS